MSAKVKHQVTLVSSKRAKGGCINEAWHLEFDDGLRLFLKYNESAPSDLFKCEGRGLIQLAWPGGVRTPRQYHHPLLHPDCSKFLLLEDVLADYSQASPEKTGWEALGRGLATIHNKTCGQFGFPKDCYLGLTPQPNNLSDSWPDFYIEHRLNYMLQLLQNRSPEVPLGGFFDFLSKAHNILGNHRAVRPNSVHGDLWSGNVLFTPGGEPVIIDPAAYNGDREVDIAMTRLFGGFDQRFYDAYNEAAPLPDGWRERQDTYNLYHILHHALLFGGGYLSQARAIVKRYL